MAVLAMVSQPRLHPRSERGQAVAVPLLQRVTCECMAGAAALISQHRDLVHRVWILRPTRWNGVGDS
jgi:hypothetical protein